MTETTSPWIRVRWAAVGAVMGVLVLMASGVVADRITTSGEALADAEPPAPSRITYPVGRQDLDPSVSTEGTVKPGGRVVGRLEIASRLPAQAAGQVEVASSGTRVQARLLGIAADGTFTVLVAPASRPQLPPRASRVVVHFELGAASDALVVPVSALFSAGDGSVCVLVVAAGEERQVEVTTGVSAGGFVAVTPVDDPLDVGDDVVVSEPER